MSEGATSVALAGGKRTVRLWWRCSLCRYRFDTFGTSHDEGRAAMRRDARVLDHLEWKHDLEIHSYDEVEALILNAGSTARVVRKSVIVE